MYIEVMFHQLLLVSTRLLQLLLFLFPFTVLCTLYPCNGCTREQSIRSDVYGIDFAFDYLSIAIQYINGTLNPIAIHYPGAEYLSLLRNALVNVDIYPYGYGNETPEIAANPNHFHANCSLNSHGSDRNIEILENETAKLLSLIADQNLTIAQYQISTPTFFTNELNNQLMTAIQHSSLPPPPSNPFLNPFPSDFAAFSALNTSYWLRDIEPEADFEFVDYMPLTI
ncbi:hypothetical protein BCON_0457g00030 [Botryotinia convoluta]|uniref:Uncharacterized protein n=1 Tax=Botryotinia convoluta TaxID=54673 RepID=A0A4Z1HII4_9HELO|nr:hypothetical protein BCON_0457g00030 [Botryotinia convoluta]